VSEFCSVIHNRAGTLLAAYPSD